MHNIYLTQALALAEIRRGFCAPNPAVGAVLVKNSQVIATGYHWASGHPHAEAAALQSLDVDAKDATLYVTLEPCCHTNKKTPPCTELLIQRGIKQVFYGFRDPNPEVAGRGEAILLAAGINCAQISLPAIDAFYASYQHWWQTRKPVVTAKLALSLDGKIAGANGQRIAITGNEAQQFTHQQRKRADAILTTARTIQNDDPLLNVRLDNEEHRKPLYILDRELNTPPTAKIFHSAARVTLFHSATANSEKIQLFTQQGVRCHTIECTLEGLNLAEVIAQIGRDGAHDLWIEAGGRCFEAFANENLLQRAFIYLAPKWLGTDAQTAFANSTDVFTTARQQQWQILGADAVCELSY